MVAIEASGFTVNAIPGMTEIFNRKS